MNQHYFSAWLLCCLLLSGCASTEQKNEQYSIDNNASLAQAAFDYAQYDKATVLYRTLIKSAPKRPEFQVMLARSLYQQDKKKAAQKILHSLLAQGESTDAALYLGKYLLRDSRVKEATTVYQQGLNIASSQIIAADKLAALHNGLGVAWLSEDQFEKGKMAFVEAMLLNPDDPSYRSNLALCWLLSGDTKQARDVFTPLLSYQKLPAQVEMNFALLLLAEGKEQQARKVLSRYLSSSQIDQDINQLKAGLVQ
ncbi:pilus assembly protein TadD [Psychromonas sp. Urea-02u-13]|nr:pilus assembly protein TadD [Psychromonas sp. Urea-02u-13]